MSGPEESTVPDPGAKRFGEALAKAEEHVDPLVGATMDGYRIDAILGRGGMGVVYRAHDTRLDRPVALKTVLFDRPEARVRFEREARAQAKLRHKNVVAVHVVGEHAGRTYLVMDLVPGGSLADVLEREEKIAEPRALAIIDAIASALEAAHVRNLIHRDVKPSNVLVEADGNVLLTDFGLAKDVRAKEDIQGYDAAAGPRSLTHPGAVIGTPAYLAPEQRRGERVDHRADMYALGITLHELVTGVRPWDDDAGPIPERTSALLAKLLAERPEDRFATYADLRAEIARLTTGERLVDASPVYRAIAFVIDFGAFLLAGMVLISVLRAFISVAGHPEFGKSWGASVAHLTAAAFLIAFETAFSTTIGKRIFRLRDVSKGRLRLAARAFLKSLPYLGFALATWEVVPKGYGGWFMVVVVATLGLPAFGAKRLALHDRMTGTRVARIMKDEG